MNKVKIKEDTIYNSNLKKEIVIAHTADIHFNENTSKKDLDKLAIAISEIIGNNTISENRTDNFTRPKKGSLF